MVGLMIQSSLPLKTRIPHLNVNKHASFPRSSRHITSTRLHSPPNSFPAAASPPPPDSSRPIVQPDAIISPDGAYSSTTSPSPDDKSALWKRAIKLPMYSVGIMPILISAMAVNAQTGSFNPTTILLFSFAAICIIAWLNLSNDVFDSVTGVDKSKKESVVNLSGNRTMVFLIANALLLVGAGLLFYMIQSTLVAKMLYAAICMGYLYQGPPFRWSYLGIGEPLCFIAFGPLATCAFYLAQLPSSSSSSSSAAAAVSLSSLTPTIIAMSVLVGITTTVILFCSHFHQIEGDTRAGKRSPLVRLGLLKGAVALKVAVGFTYMLTLVMSLLGVLPFACWTSAMVCYPIAGEMARLAEEGAAASSVVEGGDDRVAAEKLAPLKMIATKWHIAFQSCMMLGFVIQKLMVM